MKSIRMPGWRRFFGGQGRLSRAQLLGGLLALFAAYCLIAAALMIAAAVGAAPEAFARAGFMAACALLAFPLGSLLAQRGQDFGVSGTVIALAVLAAIAPALALIATPLGLVAGAPIILALAGQAVAGLILLALLAVPGHQGENRFGPPSAD